MTPDGKSTTLIVYRNERLMWQITKCRYANPITLGVGFLLLVSLPLTLWAVRSQPRPADDQSFVTFLENISWSVTIIYLFPFIVALTLKYYRAIPDLFEHLFTRLEKRDEKRIEAFRRLLNERFNEWWPPLLIILITLILNLVYFGQTLSDDKVRWLNSGTLLNDAFPGELGFSPVGLCAQIVQIVMIYWVLMVVWKGFVFAWALHRFFRTEKDAIHIDPLHPDGCCGLKDIGNVASILNLILFLIGIYLSLRVIDKVLIQETTVGADIGNPMMLGGYVIIAPLLFFLPLSAAHTRMLEAKQAFIMPVSRRCEELFVKLGGVRIDTQGHETISSLEEMEKLRHEMDREIPVWPFDFKSVQAFFGTIVVPLLPVALPFVIQLLMGNGE